MSGPSEDTKTQRLCGSLTLARTGIPIDSSRTSLETLIVFVLPRPAILPSQWKACAHEKRLVSVVSDYGLLSRYLCRLPVLGACSGLTTNHIQDKITMSVRKASADPQAGSGYDLNLGSLVQQLGDLSLLQPVRNTYIIDQHNTTLCPAPIRSFRSMSFDSQPMIGMSNERSYLVENLRRQHARGERLSHALHNVEIRLGSAQSKGEARKLRKEAGLLRSKIAESRKQEELITMRLNDLQNEDLRYFYQAQQTSLLPYSYPPPQPWAQIPMSPMTPLTPISPLTPLPAGLYHPTPLPPSPLDSPIRFSPTYPIVNAILPFEQESHLAGIDQVVSVAQQTEGSSSAKPRDVKHQSSVAEPVRRWSLADTFSPSPKDKRMSMPGLKTIWHFS